MNKSTQKFKMKTSDVQIDGTKNIAEIKVLNGPFAGTIFCFGEVKFPDETQPILSFHYYLIDGVIEDTATFEQEIGDLLVELIKEGLDRNEVIYHGGS